MLQLQTHCIAAICSESCKFGQLSVQGWYAVKEFNDSRYLILEMELISKNMYKLVSVIFKYGVLKVFSHCA